MKKILQWLFGLSIAFPLVFVLVLSVGRRWGFPNILPETFTGKNWAKLIDADSRLFGTFFMSLGISIFVAIVVAASAFILSRQIAYSRHRTLFTMMAYIPYLLSPVILAVTFQFYFIFAHLSGTVAGVLMAQFFVSFPFGIIIFLNYWNERAKSIEELSYTLGGSRWQTYTKVLFPVMKDAVALCFFQVFLISWFEYGLTNLIGTGKIKTLTVEVFNYVREANIFYAALACCLLVLPPMLLLLINKQFIFFAEKTAE